MWGKVLIAAGIMCFFIVATSLIERDIDCDIGFYGDWQCEKYRGFPFTQSSSSFVGPFYHVWFSFPFFYNFMFWGIASALLVVAAVRAKRKHDEIMSRNA